MGRSGNIPWLPICTCVTVCVVPTATYCVPARPNIYIANANLHRVCHASQAHLYLGRRSCFGCPLINEAMTYTKTRFGYSQYPISSTKAYSWIGPPVHAHGKLIPEKTRRATTNPRPPLESSRREEVKYAVSIFCVIHFDLFFKIKFPNNVRTKIDTVDLDSPCRILVCQGLRSFWGDSVRTGVNFLVIWEVKLICVRSIISCLLVPAMF